MDFPLVGERGFESLDHQVELTGNRFIIFLRRRSGRGPGTRGNGGFQPIDRLIQSFQRIAQPVGNICRHDASHVPIRTDTMGGIVFRQCNDLVRSFQPHYARKFVKTVADYGFVGFGIGAIPKRRLTAV